MKREFSIRGWRSPVLLAATLVLLSAMSLVGTTSCSMAGVYSSTAAPPDVSSVEIAATEKATTVGTTATPVTTKPPAAIATSEPGIAPTSSSTIKAVPTKTSTRMATPTPKPTATATIMVPQRAPDVNPLTGLKVVDKNVLHRLPLFVRIGNDPQIRPQSGLSSADLVYEDIMDGWWITRLTGVYLSTDLQAVGPIRSARLVNLQMVPQYQGGLVHSGASDPIRWRLSNSTIVDLDEFFHRTPYFYKEGADWRGRLFVDLKTLREYLKKEGLEKDVTLAGFAFDPDKAALPAGKAVTELTIPYPKNSVVRFQYDPVSGLYNRFVQGEPHLDALTNAQLTAANVIVQFCPHEKTDIVEDSQGTTSINIVLLGEGKALLFRDGMAIEGRWLTDDPQQMPRFLDKQGNVIPLKPGQTWIEIVPPDYEIATLPEGVLGGSMTDVGTPEIAATVVQSTLATPAGSKDYYYADEMTITDTVTSAVTQTVN